MHKALWLLLLTGWALAQSQLFSVGRVTAPVPGQRGSYIVQLDQGVQVKVGDVYLVEGLTADPIKLRVTAIEGDSVLVSTSDQRVSLSAGTAVGSRNPVTVSAGQGAGETGGTRASKSAHDERGPSAESESELARDRARLKSTSIRDRYEDPVVSNGPVNPDQVFNNQGTYAPGDVAGPMADFNNQQAPMARETTDGLPQNDLTGPYNQAGPSGASGFEKGGKGSYDASLPATFVVDKVYFFLDSRKNICLRLKVRNKGGQPARFSVAADCANSSNRIVYSVKKDFPRLAPGEYDYFNVVTSLQPRQSMFSGGYVNSASVMSSIETESFGQVRPRPKVEALRD